MCSRGCGLGHRGRETLGGEVRLVVVEVDDVDVNDGLPEQLRDGGGLPGEHLGHASRELRAKPYRGLLIARAFRAGPTHGAR